MDDIDHLGNRRVRCVRRTGRTSTARRAAHRKGREGAWARPSRTADATTDQLQKICGLKEFLAPAAVAVRWTRPTRYSRDHAQAPCVSATGPERPDAARARGLRGARRASRTMAVCARSAGCQRPNKPDQLAGPVRAPERRYGFIETPYRRVVDGKVTKRDRLPVGRGRGQISSSPGPTLDEEGAPYGRPGVSAGKNRSIRYPPNGTVPGRNFAR